MRATRLEFVLLLAAGLSACGGEPSPGQGAKPAPVAKPDGAPVAKASDPIRSEDPAVAGPALYAAWLKSTDAADADTLWQYLSKKSRELVAKESKGDQERARKNPDAAKEMKEKLGLSEDPATMDLEKLALAGFRMRLKQAESREQFRGEFGDAFVRAEMHGKLLVLFGRISGPEAAKHPKGEGHTVFVREDGAWVLDIEEQGRYDSALTKSLPLPGEDLPQSLAFTPDGATVILAAPEHVWVVPFDRAGAPIEVPVKGAWRVISDPQGAWFALECPNAADEGFTLWSLPKGEKIRVLAAERPQILAASPDGHWLLAAFTENGGPYQGTWLFPVPQGEPKAFPLPQGVGVGAAAFLADSSGVCLETYTGDLRVYALDGTRRLTIPRENLEAAQGVSIHPKEPWAVACGAEGKAFLYDLNTGEELRQLGTETNLRTPVFSPDGSQVAAFDGAKVIRYDTLTGAIRGLHRGQHFLESFAWHPKGQTLVGAGRGDGRKPVLYVYSAKE